MSNFICPGCGYDFGEFHITSVLNHRLYLCNAEVQEYNKEMTERQLFYTKLHGKIAKELNTDPGIVSTLRTKAIGDKMDIEEIADWLISHIEANEKKTVVPKNNQKFKQMLDLIDSLTKSQWELLTQPTDYDGKTE